LRLQPDTDAQLALRQVQSALLQESKCEAYTTNRNHLIGFSRAALDAEFQTDLTALSAHAKRSEHEWLTQFCAVNFTVAMIGFKPGFPYLLGLPEALAMPRLAKPRISVAKGSVAIGGAFAGIYPARSAGGWHVVGITDAVLFDVAREKPCLFAAGDEVRFELREG
jgi:KipI family sensor histidine kinase inhibitor